MSKAKKATTKAAKARLIAAAETAGRGLGRAVGAVERAIGRVRVRKSPQTARRRATKTARTRR